MKEPVVLKREMREDIFQICTTYTRTNTLKNSLKLLEGPYSATCMIREDVCVVFCGNTEKTDTAEQGKTDTHLKEVSGERKLKCFPSSYTKTCSNLSAKPVWQRNLW